MSRATKELACFIVNSVAGNRIDQAVDQIQDCKTELDMLGIQDIVADAWYSKERFVKGVVSFHATCA